MFLTISKTHNFAYGSLVLLQPPLHLSILTLLGKNQGSLLLIFIICGFILHSLLFIEAHFNSFAFNILQPKILLLQPPTF